MSGFDGAAFLKDSTTVYYSSNIFNMNERWVYNYTSRTMKYVKTVNVWP